MYQQHNIKIKIHNDMIQMLKNVNKINIMLKITQTRLQKENKNKNVIIYYLKTALYTLIMIQEHKNKMIFY